MEMEAWQYGLAMGVIAFFVTHNLQVAVVMGLVAFALKYFFK